MSEKKVLTKREQTRQMTILAMFIAIIAVLGLVPNGAGGTLGFIKIAPTIEATIVHIPVLIGAVLFGRKMGIYLGIAFGVVANIAAFIYASPYFVYPWVAILPRFIFGLLIFDLTRLLIKLFKNKLVGIGVSFFLLSLVHTILVLTMFWTSFAMVNNFGLFEAIKPYFSALVLYNVIPFTPLVEALIAAIVGSAIVINLAKYLKNSNNSLLEIEVD